MKKWSGAIYYVGFSRGLGSICTGSGKPGDLQYPETGKCVRCNVG